MQNQRPMHKLLNICIVALFLSVSFAGCLENEQDSSISPNDVVVNPNIMMGGEFQPLVITAKRDISVFIPHMVIDPMSNYVQNGTILDIKTGETEQLRRNTQNHIVRSQNPIASQTRQSDLKNIKKHDFR